MVVAAASTAAVPTRTPSSAGICHNATVARLHRPSAQAICTGHLHRPSAQAICTGRLHRPSAQAGPGPIIRAAAATCLHAGWPPVISVMPADMCTLPLPCPLLLLAADLLLRAAELLLLAMAHLYGTAAIATCVHCTLYSALCSHQSPAAAAGIGSSTSPWAMISRRNHPTRLVYHLRSASMGG
jgi:hypothetical protein